MTKVSRKFFATIKTNDRPGYKIAQEAGLNPVLLSKILHGYERIRPNDFRVIAVGRVIGLTPDECFEARDD